MMSIDSWNASFYESNHSYVWQYGDDLLQILNAKCGEHILDLGCGTGQLTHKIGSIGANVIGIDYAPTMIEKAQQNYPDLKFMVADAKKFHTNQLLDAIFSNAVLHWIKEPDAVINCIQRALKSGGRFVAEFGGKGNVKAIVEALDSALNEIGYIYSKELNPWYFPSIGEYVSLLEKHGFEVTYAALFDRPTPLEGGDAGITNWIKMFAGNIFLKDLSFEQKTKVLTSVEERLKPLLYRGDHWIADYRRLRIVSMKA